MLALYPLPGNQAHAAVRLSAAGTAAKPITIRGIAVDGQRPRIVGGASAGTGYAAVHFLQSHFTVLENVVVSNGINRRRADGSIDGTLYSPQYHQCVKNEANEVTLRDVLVADCANNGVFAVDRNSGSLTLERVEITRSGCVPGLGGMKCNDGAHPIYVATDPVAYPQSRLRITDSLLHGNHAGVTVKSRARRLELRHSWVELTNSNEVQAVGVFGHDVTDGDAPRQASLANPVHADIVGNVFVVDGASTAANAVIRAGGDFNPADVENANTFGRVRLVSNTFVVAGAFGKGQRNRPLVRFFGRPEGLMAFDNMAVVADSAAGKVVFLHEDDSAPPRWAAPDGKARVLLSHNHLPTGSIALTDRNLKTMR